MALNNHTRVNPRFPFYTQNPFIADRMLKHTFFMRGYIKYHMIKIKVFVIYEVFLLVQHHLVFVNI